MTRYEVLVEKLNRLRAQILTHGPVTLYDLEKALNLPSTTVQRHLKILLREDEIAPYETEHHRSGNIKTFYGPTLYGFIRAFRIPRRIAKKKFKSIMGIWLREEKFKFFLPKGEVLEALGQKDVEANLSTLCQMIANMLPEAEDLSYYLEDQGYSESNPTQIIDLAIRLGWGKNRQEFISTSRVLCKHLPSYRKQIEQSIQAHRERIDLMEEEILGQMRNEK